MSARHVMDRSGREIVLKVGRRKYYVNNSLWGGPVCSDEDGEPHEITGAIERALQAALATGKKRRP